jgi:NhaA family Na+:H+ antiporter
MAVFFLLVGLEIKREALAGGLRTWPDRLLPGAAALGGMAVPALVYAALNLGSGALRGWAIPAATDIAFALGVLAVFGRGLPSTLRVFLLALAVLDDLIAIVIIAVVFAHDTDFWALGGAVVALAVFWLLARRLRTGRDRAGRRQTLLIIGLVVIGVVSWWLVYHSGVHATIAGVALGLLLPRKPGHLAYDRIEPFSNAIVLPVFAFAAAAVVIPSVGIGELSPTFFAIVLALPVGKVIGITLFGGIASRLGRSPDRPTLGLGSVAAVGVLGGIGFTVSLLMNELAFARSEEIVDEGTLAVLVGSGIAMIASAIVVTFMARKARRVADATT